jgi:hypothetical protein
MLQVPNPAMHHPKRVRRGRLAEVVPLDQRDGKASERGIPGHANAENPAADDNEIEFPFLKLPRIASHQDASDVTEDAGFR